MLTPDESFAALNPSITSLKHGVEIEVSNSKTQIKHVLKCDNGFWKCPLKSQETDASDSGRVKVYVYLQCVHFLLYR